ncbi:MAG: hypothetical protein KC652_09320 [Cyanobacteria bacterium HKST-UBA01]|nr:hypothetical protein [Cyanobacteria bacterium HKST-UBA01]
MLDLWRPPAEAGDPIGCLSTTYTFDGNLFDEQCLGRFLDIESDPNREDLAFLIERELKLGSTYAGVLVDHTRAGVDHSLRWDILPVRIPRGKQHAKLSLLVWANHARVIVSSANLTVPGYRLNHEIASTLEIRREDGYHQHIKESCFFLRGLLPFVPGGLNLPTCRRASDFLDRVELIISEWSDTRRSKSLQQHLVFTSPATSIGLEKANLIEARSTLEDAVSRCRQFGGSPARVIVASPFFDSDEKVDRVTERVCKLMARKQKRHIAICVPGEVDPLTQKEHLAAPRSILDTAERLSVAITFKLLPSSDLERNSRPWHAKMVSLQATDYVAVVIGSSNYTKAGLGIGDYRNTEANILTIARREPHAREPGQLLALWPEMLEIRDPYSAEWQGTAIESDEENDEHSTILPSGFTSAIYKAGPERSILFYLDPTTLPDEWTIGDCLGTEILTSSTWKSKGSTPFMEVCWTPTEPPEILQVKWTDGAVPWSLNVEDVQQLPAPSEIEHMSFDEMLQIIAAIDPSAAVRAWVKQRRNQNFVDDDDIDTAEPTDLNPLHRYVLCDTYLWKVRKRARILARLREKLQSPVWSVQALQWRLEGSLGVRTLAYRLFEGVNDYSNSNNAAEPILALADLLLILADVDYAPIDDALSKDDFQHHYGLFLRLLAEDLDEKVDLRSGKAGKDVTEFWKNVVKKCQR